MGLRKAASKVIQPINVLERIYQQYDRILQLAEEDRLFAYDFVPVILLGHNLNPGQEGIWGYLCAPASGGKTELFIAMRQCDDLCIFRDELTPKAGASGYREKIHKGQSEEELDNSLLKDLDGKSLVVHDLSTMLSNPQSAGPFYNFLRAAYSKNYNKQSGTAGLRAYNATFSFLGGVVGPVLDQVQRSQQMCGERMVVLRIGRSVETEGDVQRQLWRIHEMKDGKEALRESLRAEMRTLMLLGQEQVKLGTPELSRDLCDEIGSLAHLVVNIRTQPRRDRGTNVATSAEKAARLGQVLIGMAEVRCRLCGRAAVDATDVSFVQRIGHDTIDAITRVLLSQVCCVKKVQGVIQGKTVRDLAGRIGMDGTEVRSQMVQWQFEGLVDCTGTGEDARWFPAAGIAAKLRSHGLIAEAPRAVEFE